MNKNETLIQRSLSDYLLSCCNLPRLVISTFLYIMSVSRNLSGIYKIESAINRKCYIGSSAQTNVRKNQHYRGLLLNNHDNQRLQNHYNKYGKDDLTFSVIELCEKCKLIEREQYYIDTFNPEFNICKIAGSVAGVKRSADVIAIVACKNRGRKRSDESKRLMSLSQIGHKHTEEAKRKMSEYRTGKKLSEETKKKIGEANKGKLLGRVLPEETRRKLSASRSGALNHKYGKPNCESAKIALEAANAKRSKPVVVSSVNRDDLHYSSIGLATRCLGISKTKLLYNINNGVYVIDNDEYDKINKVIHCDSGSDLSVC